MWARVMEGMLGCWLLISPFIFRHATEEVGLWTIDLVFGSAVIVLAMLSYWRPTQKAHLFILLVATLLVVFGYFAESYPAQPALQSEMIVGLLLMMLAIVPNEATKPPIAWRKFEQQRGSE